MARGGRVKQEMHNNGTRLNYSGIISQIQFAPHGTRILVERTARNIGDERAAAPATQSLGRYLISDP